MTDTRSPTCTRCNGTGKNSFFGSACYCCCGAGTFPPLDVDAILRAIRGRKGLRSAKPDQGTILGRRAAYVWRWARFHGGADVTIPCTVDNSGDPWGKDLDVIADRVARHVFGTDMAAAHRWGTALGLTASAPAGLPASAYAGGPEHDGADDDTVAMLACQSGAV